MLYGYPPEATQRENWVHECLRDAVICLHDHLGRRMPRWPLPIPEKYRNELEGDAALKRLLTNYFRAASRLPQADRQRVLQALDDQNNVSALLKGQANCERAEDFPDDIMNAAKELFGHGFNILLRKGIRDRMYEFIMEGREERVCPFCGFEPFNQPGSKREDLDHYLARHIYPFSAANLRNLAPMGHKCNSEHKGQKDIILNGRVAIAPYETAGIEISLINSEFSPGNDRAPRWVIEFIPNSPEAQTWDNVFDIRHRYKRDILDPAYLPWVRQFTRSSLCKELRNNFSEAGLISALGDAVWDFREYGLNELGFLRSAVFEMLLHRCTQGDEDIIAHLKDAIKLASEHVVRAHAV